MPSVIDYEKVKTSFLLARHLSCLMVAVLGGFCYNAW